jgi:hypothetical protein
MNNMYAEDLAFGGHDIKCHEIEEQTHSAWSEVTIKKQINKTADYFKYLFKVFKDNPSAQDDLLDNKEEQVKQLIYYIGMLPDIKYRDKLVKRLITLFYESKEEAPDSIGIDSFSFRNFYNFLSLNSNLKYPAISLTPECHIYASWRDEQKRLFSVHFLPGNNVRFVIFKPNNRHPEQNIRLSGIATTDILRESVEPHGVLDWIT